MKVSFKVKGMTCASCANTIEKALKVVNGVSKASVNFAGNSAAVEYDAVKTSVPQLKLAVSKVGYELISYST